MATGDGGGDHAGTDHLESEADGVGSGGAGGGDIEDGAGDAEVDGDVAGTGGGHGAGDGEGVDAGVAGVELGGFGLFGLAAAAGTTDDDGDVFGGVVLEEVAVLGGLTGGKDGELGGAVGGADDSGVEVLAGVEVFDGGGVGEAETLRGAGRLWIGREGGDAGGPSEERGAEGLDAVADGGDAAEAGDDDTIQRCLLCAWFILEPVQKLHGLIRICNRAGRTRIRDR